MGKYKTKLEREHLDKVSQLGCICCGAIAEIHHIRDKVGMGRRSSHFIIDLEKTQYIWVRKILLKSLELNENY